MILPRRRCSLRSGGRLSSATSGNVSSPTTQPATSRDAAPRPSTRPPSNTSRSASRTLRCGVLRRSGGGCRADAAPIFVVGLPRSGSTLIEQILSSHCAVEGTMELPDMALLARDLGRRRSRGAAGLPGYRDRLDAASSGRARRTLYRRDARSAAARPAALHRQDAEQLGHVGLIHADPAERDNHRRAPPPAGRLFFSAFKQYFAQRPDFTTIWRISAAITATIWPDGRTGHRRTAGTGAARAVRGTWCAHTEAQIRRLLDHCGLPFDAACLRFHETARSVRTASSEQVRQPIYRQASITGGISPRHWNRCAVALALRWSASPASYPNDGNGCDAQRRRRR